MRGVTILAVVGLAVSASTVNAALLFDNMTTGEAAAAAGGQSNFASTSSTPNTFMGDAYQLVSGASAIRGFDVYPVNTTGVNYNALKITIYVWGGVNLGTVNAATPAFNNLLGSFVLTSTGAFNTGFFFPFESASPGVTPGISLASPLAIPNNVIGLTFNYQGSTNGGTTFTSPGTNNLTSLIVGNLPDVGSEVLNQPTGGYYRNAGSPAETNGNFTSTYRSLGASGTFSGTNQVLGVRVYGDTNVPTPASAAVLGLAGIVSVRRRRA